MNLQALDHLMGLLAAASLTYLLAYAIRIRVRRPLPRHRWSLPNPLARVTSLLGLAVALASSPSPTRAESRSPVPRPRGRVIDPPWTAPASPPPRHLARIQVGSPSSSDTHVAIHGPRSESETAAPPRCRLFPRACPMRSPHHVVMPGESLWTIAARWLDTTDPRRIAPFWPRIYRLNQALIGPDPDLIRPGQVLEIPRGRLS